jgi:hypothetical protein
MRIRYVSLKKLVIFGHSSYSKYCFQICKIINYILIFIIKQVIIKIYNIFKNNNKTNGHGEDRHVQERIDVCNPLKNM